MNLTFCEALATRRCCSVEFCPTVCTGCLSSRAPGPRRFGPRLEHHDDRDSVTNRTSTRAAMQWWTRLRAQFQRTLVAYPASALVVALVTVTTIVLRRRVQSPLGQSPYDGQLY